MLAPAHHPAQSAHQQQHQQQHQQAAAGLKRCTSSSSDLLGAALVAAVNPGCEQPLDLQPQRPGPDGPGCRPADSASSSCASNYGSGVDAPGDDGAASGPRAASHPAAATPVPATERRRGASPSSSAGLAPARQRAIDVLLALRRQVASTQAQEAGMRRNAYSSPELLMQHRQPPLASSCSGMREAGALPAKQQQRLQQQQHAAPCSPGKARPQPLGGSSPCPSLDTGMLSQRVVPAHFPERRCLPGTAAHAVAAAAANLRPWGATLDMDLSPSAAGDAAALPAHGHEGPIMPPRVRIINSLSGEESSMTGFTDSMVTSSLASSARMGAGNDEEVNQLQPMTRTA